MNPVDSAAGTKAALDESVLVPPMRGVYICACNDLKPVRESNRESARFLFRIAIFPHHAEAYSMHVKTVSVLGGGNTAFAVAANSQPEGF